MVGSTGTPEDRGYHDPAASFRGLRLALIVDAIFAAVLLGGDISYASAAPGRTSFGGALATLRGPVQVAELVSWLAIGVTFAWWIRTLVVNSRTLHDRGPRCRPWSGVWLLIPLANLFMPFLVVRELWSDAHHQSADGAPRPNRPPTPPLVFAWGAALFVSVSWTIAGPVANFWGFGYEALFFAQAAVNAIGVLHIYLLYRVALAITRAQAAQRAAHRLDSERLPPKRA